MLKLFFLLASVALAQSPAWPVLVSISPGFPTDTHCTGGFTFTGISTTFPTLRYGSSFSCRAAAPVGFFIVRFYLLEPNQTTAGARVFTISTNGQQSDPIDIVASGTPANTPLIIQTTAVSYFGSIRISFDTITRFAVVSQIDVIPIQVFDNVSTPGPPQFVASSFQCDPNAPTAMPCGGLMYARFTKPDGTTTAPYVLVPSPALPQDGRWLPAQIP